MTSTRRTSDNSKKTVADQQDLLLQFMRGRQGILLVCILAAGVIFSMTNETFLTTRNLFNIGVQSSMILLVAFGMTVVIISGGIDLSVGSMAALAGVSTVWFITNTGLPTPLAMLAGLGVGGLVGVFHGLIIVQLGVPSLIATLATLTALRGVAFLVSGGYTIRATDPQLRFLANGSVGPIPLPILITAIGLVLIHVMLAHTILGRSFYAIGGNRQAARLAGINVRAVSIAAYVVCAVLAAAAGLIAASRTASGSPIIGSGWELQAVGIVILGGANLFGGSGGVMGTVLAGLFLSMINNWMSLEGFGTTLQGLVFGALLILIVAINQRGRQT